MKTADRISIILREKKARNLTNEDIAKMSNVPKITISRILSGYTENPGSKTLDQIEEAMKIEISSPAKAKDDTYFKNLVFSAGITELPKDEEKLELLRRIAYAIFDQDKKIK